MNIIKKLTLRHLKENKSRTVITTLGICISVAMITAVFVSIASFFNFFEKVSIYNGGDYHAEIWDTNKELRDTLKDDNKVGEVYFSADINENISSYKIEGTKDYLGTGSFIAADKGFFKNKVTCKYEGSFPENQNEIAVEQDFIEKNNLDWKIGDTVSIPVGIRTLDDSEDAFTGYYIQGEKFKKAGDKKFRVACILHNNLPTVYSGEILRGLSQKELGNTGTVYIKLKEINFNSYFETEDVIANAIETSGESCDYHINSDYLMTKLAICWGEEDSLAFVLFLTVCIILSIIIVASVFLIYNAFGMSLSERTRYLGMLCSVGATKKQIKKSVYFEGLFLGAIGIPIGILAGIGGIGVTLKIVMDRLISSNMINGAENLDVNMVIPIWAIICIVLFSGFTIFISSVIPAHKASKITPIEALRQNKEFKLKAKKLKSPKIIRKIFGYEGELAHKNIKRNGRKSRVITASIIVSVVLFITVNYFCSLLMQSGIIDEGLPYQAEVYVEYKDKDKMLKAIEKVDGINDMYCVTCESSVFPGIEEGEGTGLSDEFCSKDALTSAYSNAFNDSIYTYINIIDDEDFNKLCSDNGINYREFYTNDPDADRKALLMNNISHTEDGSKVFNDNLVGNMLYDDSYREDFQSYNIEIAGMVDYDSDNYACNLNPQNSVSLYIPVSMYFSSSFYDPISPYSLGIETDKHEEVCEELHDICSNNFNSGVIDIEEQRQAMNSTVFVLEVFIYGFIALITLITLANITNTISTGIDLRRKEFAMLKSVGTTQKGFYKMICLESILYAVKSLIIAIPLSIIASYGMNRMMASDMLPFTLDFKMYIAVIIAVFVVVGLSMLFSIQKIRKDSIIETLKEDIN